MFTIDKKSNCCGCYACFNICPIGCISMVEDNEGFYYPRVDNTKCINCNVCIDVCPIKNCQSFSDSNTYNKLSYAAYSCDACCVKASSSGGIFSVLSAKVLRDGGVVYGAAYDESFSVVHKAVEQASMLSTIQGSKYVQSKIGITFKEIKNRLEIGQLVLFSGTPCQVAGLKNYLHKPYENLITIDVVCHGVPSDLLWKKYLYEKSKGKVRNVLFRDKSTGWKTYSITILSDKRYSVIHNYSSYMRAYIYGLSMRPSCYDCRFKDDKHVSEITLGDFWGIEKIVPDLSDVSGVSWIVINNIKGKALFDSIDNTMLNSTSVDTNEAKKCNPAYSFSSTIPLNRQQFFERINEVKFDKLVNDDLCKISGLSRIRYSLKSKIEKLLNG